jgi:hypothetical protein
MADVKIFGKKFPAWGVGVVAVGGVGAVYLAYRAKQNAAASSASSSAIDPLTGLPASEDNQIDPLTNMTYLSEAQEYGSVAAAEQAVSAENSALTAQGAVGSSAYGDNGYYGGAGTVVSSDTAAATTYASNAQWAQAVEAGLTDLGYSSTDVASALGAYLGNLPETSAQASITQVALAEYGQQPSGSYTIIMATPTGTGTTTGGGTTTTTGTTTTSTAAPTVSGGHVVSVNATGGVVGWTGHNAVKYQVTIHGPGSENGRENTITGTQATYSGLESKHTYDVTVVPVSAAGKSGAAGTITFVTK